MFDEIAKAFDKTDFYMFVLAALFSSASLLFIFYIIGNLLPIKTFYVVAFYFVALAAILALMRGVGISLTRRNRIMILTSLVFSLLSLMFMVW